MIKHTNINNPKWRKVMTMVRFNTHVGADGSILIPTTPFADGEEVEVILQTPKTESRSLDDGWQPDPAAVRRIIASRKFTVELTDEEEKKLKHERRMRKMQ
jgi:hypothetical protein